MKSLIVTEKSQIKKLLLHNLLIAGLRELSGDTDKMGCGHFFFLSTSGKRLMVD